MLIRIWLFILTVVSCELTGENICEVEERYPVNITEFSLKNVTVRNYKWCMGFPPRCSFYTLKAVKVPEVVERLQIKLVRKCCPGFVENSKRDGCVQCRKCYEGTCGNDGNCVCNSGFRGEDCADACQPMRWGINCQQECLCEHGVCNPRTGRCDCPTGWFGTRCEVPCLEGFYGKHCINRCSCGERDLCSPETGECLTKPPRKQEHQSTRAIHYMTDDILNLTVSLNKHRSTPSLKKYYTFDLELNNNNATEGREGHINHNVIEKINPKGTRPNTTVTTKNKHENGDIINSAENSAESTTEMSSEIGRKIEDVAIIGEDGSLEHNDKVSSEEQSQEIVDEKLESKEKYTTQKTKANKENKIEHSEEDIRTEISDESPNEIHVSQKKHQKNTEDSNSRNQKMLRPGPFNTMSPVHTHNSQVHKDMYSPKKGENISATTLDIITKLISKTTSNVSKHEVTIDRLEKIIQPTTFKPHSKTTPSKKNGIKNITKVIEESELQDLNIINNILTIIETTTQSNPVPTTVESITFVKNGILPIDDVIPSTKSIELRNDLHNAESTENQILMKGAYERRNSFKENGEGASEEFDYSTSENNVTTHMAIVGLILFILVLILSGIVLVHHFTRKGRKKTTSMKIDNQNFAGGHSVSVYTHSIFHTPLPDPPTFDNPVFKSPSEITTDHRTIQTHVICSLNFPENKVNDEKEYTYDHPPSTGSYRAASIPEPPEIFETLTTEPVYDEIPSNRRGNQTLSPPPSYKSSCLYMNTCGKTRF